MALSVDAAPLRSFLCELIEPICASLTAALEKKSAAFVLPLAQVAYGCVARVAAVGSAEAVASATQLLVAALTKPLTQSLSVDRRSQARSL